MRFNRKIYARMDNVKRKNLITPTNPDVWLKVSPSRLNGLDNCPRMLWWKYETDEVEPAGFWAARGLVVEAMCLSVIRNSRSGVGDTHSIEDEGRRAWQEQVDKDHSLTEYNDEMNKQFPRWVAGAQSYQHSGELVDDQMYVEVDFEGLPLLGGFLDLLVNDSDQLIVRDIKAKGQLSNSVPLAWRRQLTVYLLGIAKKYNLKRLPRAEIDMISVGKTPGHRRIPVDISGEDVSELVNQLEKIQYHVQNEYWPQNRASDLCREDRCAFYTKCVYGDSHVSFKDAIERCNALSLLQT